MPYECGITPESDARHRFTVRFYVVAILFVIFDVETIFLYPWAVQFQALMPYGLAEMGFFLGILIVGYIWLWKLRCSSIGFRQEFPSSSLPSRLRIYKPNVRLRK